MKKFTNKDYINKLKETNPNIIPIDSYIDTRTKIEVMCQNGHKWKSTPRDLFGGHGCPQCYNNKRHYIGALKNNDWFLEKLKENKIDIIPLENYDGCDKKIKFKCSCGNENYYTTPIRALRGQKCSLCRKERMSKKNSKLYDNSITDEERQIKRNYDEYNDFVKNCLKRDNYTCLITNQIGKKLVVHHLDGYNWCKEKRTDMYNGVTLSEKIHIEFHKMFGYKNNTKEQFIEFVDYLYQNNRINEERYLFIKQFLK